MAFPGAAEGVGDPICGSPLPGQGQLTGHHSLCRASPSATQITVVLPHSSCQLLYLGTESGSVFVVQLPAFRALEDQTISSDAVLQR